MDAIEIEAPAKVNLRLRVLSQLTSGYHALETIFCALSLADTLRFRRGGGDILLSVEGGIDVGPVDDNLVVRAARRFFLEMGGVGEGVRIELVKRIPSAAGLGGGSSDAAATLRALDALYAHPFGRERLFQLAIELGSDVPFFLCGSTLALAWGRGERLLTLTPPAPRPVLIAHPGVAMPTGQAFQRMAELRGGGYGPPAAELPLAGLSGWDGLAGVAGNDFEEVAAERIPVLVPARDAMLAAGAEIALLAGSGASLVGIFPSPEAAARAEAEVRAIGLATWRATTLETFPEPRPFRAAAG